LEVPKTAQLQNGRVPFSFIHTFTTPGSHLVSVILEPDPPQEKRPAKYAIKDVLPGDNRQDFALEIVRALPVWIVDGNKAGAQARPDFLRQALEARDPVAVVRTRVVSSNEFDPSVLSAAETNKAEEMAVRPRVLVLRDVPQLTAAQQEAISQFLADGGGVLMTLGKRVVADAYNMNLYRGGKGWFPALLEGMSKEAAHPAPGGSDHPALSLFLEKPKDGQGPARYPQLGRVRFSQWWKLTPPGRNSAGVQVATLRTTSSDSPFLIEWIDPNRSGRLLLCAVPLDDSWGPELIRDECFVPLVHELVYYLAGARSAEFNLEPGQPLRYRLESIGDIEQYKLQTPLGQTKPLSTNPADKNTFVVAVDRLPQGSMLRMQGTRETGVYRLLTAEGATVYYVVRPKMTEESDLAPSSDEDRDKVAQLIPGLKYLNEHEQPSEDWIDEDQRKELWWWLLLGVIALLCGEVWLTRRIVKNR
jgi:hypothetical protein